MSAAAATVTTVYEDDNVVVKVLTYHKTRPAPSPLLKVCGVCGALLDPVLAAYGETNHPTCEVES